MALASWTDRQVIDQLNSGYRWTSSTITYSFPTTAWGTYVDPSDSEGGFSALNATQQVTAVLALTLWDELIAPSFVRLDTASFWYESDIEFGNATFGVDYAHAYYPGVGTVWFNRTYDSAYGTDDLVTPTIGAHGFATFVHEIGHAIGLEHMGNYNGTAARPSSYQDSTVYSIMSYFGPSWGGGKANGEGLVAWADWVGADKKLYSPQTPMMNDIMAIQSIYGADTTTRTGDTVYGFGSNVTGAAAAIFDFNQNRNPILCIWDADGNDTLNLSGWSAASVVNLAPGSFSSGNSMTLNISIARDAWIENAITGAGSDRLTGNILANRLEAGAGNDVISGLAGDDTLLAAAGDDTLLGGDGNDILDGGTGNDQMSGGAGDDTYFVDSAKDVITEAVNGGIDTVRVTASSYTLSAFVDNLDYVGTGAFKGVGSADANTMTGGIGADVLDGAAGNDRLYGGLGNDSLVGGIGNDLLDGEDGADTMAGGVGNDSYHVDNAGDVVTELVSAGTDTVFTTLSAYTLGGHVENLTFEGSGDFTGTGNTLANVLTGGDGDDVLSGLDGNDWLSGGDGNDILVGGTGADTIDGGDGNDIVTFGDLWANISWVVTDIATATFRFMGTLIGGDVVTGVETFRDSTGVERSSAWLITPGDFVPEVSIVADAPSVAEGNAGEQTVTFTVSLTMASAVEETVAWSVAGSGAQPANFADILGDTSGVLTFAAGETEKTISITLRGDTKYETNETFSVVLGALSEGLWRGPSTATMTILNDETAPTYNVINGTSSAQTLTGTVGTDRISGGGGNDTLRGGLGHDVLIASSGNDTLDGGEGEDDMTGGAGNDIYIVDNIGDAVIETSTGGTDTIRTTLERYALGAWIEELVYTGTSSWTGIGNTLANSIVGGIGNDTLYGGAGNDTLNGGGGENTLYGEAGDDRLIGGAQSDILDGGTGNDQMSGGAGDDTYFVDSAKDVITEAVNGGIDTVRVTASGYTLSAYVDNLDYVGTGAFKGVGSADANTMTGGIGADVLDGAAGNDRLYGGLGNDSLVGGIGNDLLDGEDGADTMAGGVGNDSYYVDNTGDVVTELVSAGTDTVFTTLSAYTLGGHVENLTYEGSGDFTGTGNTLANVLTGGDGDDVLSGLDGNDWLSGGEGNDILVGGTGSDRFYFNVFGDGNVDTISDFNSAADTILLEADFFTDAGDLGALLEAAFGQGSEATTADQRILHDQGTGNIFYDADGSGAIDPVVFARVASGTLLDHSDFSLV